MLLMVFMLERERQARERAQRTVEAQQAWLGRSYRLAGRSAAVQARFQAGKVTFRRLVSALGCVQR